MPSLNRRTMIAGAALGVAAAAIPLRATARGRTVKVSSYGYDPQDSTRFIRQAIDSGADTVILDNVNRPWVSGPLVITRSDFRIIVEDGVVLKSKAGAFPDRRDGLWTFHGVSNVTLTGYGARSEMSQTDYPEEEWRAGVRIGACTNVVVEGLQITGSPGDGVIVGGLVVDGRVQPGTFSRSIVLRDLYCNNNRRNGLAAIAVQGLEVTGCAFVNTRGKLPEAGIDIEPDSAGQPVQDVVIQDCYVADNGTSSFQINLMKYTTNHAEQPPPSILIERCRFGPSPNQTFHLQPGAHGRSKGWVRTRDSLIDNDAASGTTNVYANGAGEDRLKIFFDTTTFSSMQNSARTEPLIKLWTAQLAPNVEPVYGNTWFDDCVVLADQSGPWLRGIEADVQPDPVMTTVHGAFTGQAANPNYDTSGRTDDVRLSFTPSPKPVPALTVCAHSARRKFGPGFVITRPQESAGETVAVRYRLAGTARHRTDYHGVSGVAVLRPGETSVTVPIKARTSTQSGRSARPATVQLQLEPAPSYTIKTGSATLVLA